MLYEPVGYILEYEISAIAFLIIIMFRYFSAKRFPNQKNRMFAVILWIVFADLILDVVSSVIIDNVFRVPLPVTYAVNSSFYFLQIFLPLMLMCFTLMMAGYIDHKRMKKLFPLFLPGIVTLIMLLMNPVTKLLFYVDPQWGYVHGKMFIYTYGVCLFYMGAAFIAAFRNRSHLRKDEYMTVCRFLVIALVAMIIQYIYPVLMITGVAIAIAVIMMYFAIQNPDSMVDTTTGAFTYDAMLSFFHDRMCERNQVQLVAIKIYNMSRINELLGIENGSILLSQVSSFMKSSVSDAWVFRMRGSCFVAVTRKSEDYHLLSKRLNLRAGQPWTVGNTEVLLQATVCCISAEELLGSPISPADAVSYLETAFVQNERSSNRINSITVGAELLDKVRRRRDVEEALRGALKNGKGLELYFQPMLSVREKRFTSAEVLLRFYHTEMGYISPEEFVPIAESRGFVTDIDEMVVRKTCAFIKESKCFEKYRLERLEINLSALEFMHRRLPELLNDIMTSYDVAPSCLCFEITETAATESFELLKDCMTKISQLGCGFALDDFGTGYANITQVIRLPFSVVKLDKSLLYGPAEVLEDMVHMFTRMSRSTVAEGIETEYQAELLKSFGINYIQGYYYAKPMNQNDFIQFLQKNQKIETEESENLKVTV